MRVTLWSGCALVCSAALRCAKNLLQMSNVKTIPRLKTDLAHEGWSREFRDPPLLPIYPNG
jgi:hypothetical protein